MYLLYHGSVGTYGTIHFELWMVAASMHSNFEFRSSPLVLPIADLFQPPPTDFRSIADPPTGRHPNTPSIEGKHIIQKQKSWSQNPLSNTNLDQQDWMSQMGQIRCSLGSSSWYFYISRVTKWSQVRRQISEFCDPMSFFVVQYRLSQCSWEMEW